MAERQRSLIAPRRDYGGSIAGNRLTLQANWAICELVRRLERGEDVLVIVENVEDVEVYSPSQAPRNLELFQVKSGNAAGWPLSKLSRRDGSKASWMASLVRSVQKVHDNLEVVAGFVASVPLTARLLNGGSCSNREQITIREIEEADVAVLVAKVSKELGGSDVSRCVRDTRYWVTHLRPRGHDTLTTGKIAEYLHRRYGEQAPQAAAFYSALVAQIRRKADFEQDSATMEELRAKKGVTTEELDLRIRQAFQASAPDYGLQYWGLVQPELEAAGVSLLDRRNTLTAWKRYDAERREPKPQHLREIERAVDAAILNMGSPNINSLLGAARVLADTNLSWERPYVEAITLWRFTADQARLLSQAPEGSETDEGGQRT